MEVDCLSFRKTGYFSSLICDYLEQSQQLEQFYNRWPTLDNFKLQIQEKSGNYAEAHRPILSQALVQQYKGFEATESTLKNIERLKEATTFTVTTGHQLNLFTGPLYFLYKILTTINLTEALKERYPDNHFVPVYWMATEDHDFEEINYFNFEGQKIQWDTVAAGAVGRLSTQGLEGVFAAFATQLGSLDKAEVLKKLFKSAYLEHDTLAAATRFLVNKLFGAYGLVILDGDDIALKRLLVPFIKDDIFDNLPYRKVVDTMQELTAISDAYPIQVNPREINYFYLKDGLRERIVEKDGVYRVNNTQLKFTKEALEEEMVSYPERFSPNVITRPLYQEVILPNLCYIGGGGELAYWFELKRYFDALGVSFPVLLLRNSALLVSEKQYDKVGRLHLSIADLFLKQPSLINKKIRQISNIEIDFTAQKKALEVQFQELYHLAKQTDSSFLGAVGAQEAKQKKGLDHLEKRLLKAQKRKLKDHVIRITEIQNQLFPNHSLQERHMNFAEAYLEYGDQLIPGLKQALDPFKQEFLILRN